MAKGKAVKTTRKRPGPAGRMGRRLLRVGVLAAAVAVGRRTAGGRAGDGPAPPTGSGRAQGAQGAGAAAGGVAPTEHETSPDRVADDDRGRQADKPQEIPPAGWKDIALRLKNEVKKDQVPLLSAGVAFYALLSLFPMIIAAVSIYGLVANPDTVSRQLTNLTDLLGKEARDIIGPQIEQITGGAGGALSFAVVFGILTALWSASSGMKALITGVNMAYDESETRKFVKMRGLALGLTLGAMLLMGIALFLIVGVPPLADGLPTALEWTLLLLRWPLLAALLVVGLAVIYRYAPDRDNPKWGWVSWGSGVATLLWVVASIGFSIYASSFGNYNKTYGALAGVIVLLFWLFLSALVVLVGAELNAEMELQTAKDTTAGPTRPMGERDAHAADHVAESPAASGS
jgi:membrane protein